MSRRSILFGLLMIAAAARLLMQMAAMPPYAGLDEVYHVARLAFVRSERRNPTVGEPSIPPYLMASIAADPRAMPAFGEVGSRWPDLIRARGAAVVDQPFTAADLRPYVVRNYEAQQTSLYYSLVAPLVPVRSALFELRCWRVLSLLFALITVLASAMIGHRWFGAIGVLSAAILLSLPTWLTLVVRASNDAFACMLVAIALAITSGAPRRWPGVIAEALCWGLALNAKMYTWPLLIVVPFFWRDQRPRPLRMAIVAATAAIAVALTLAELSVRTHNPLGVVAFDRPGGSALQAGVNLSEIVRVTIASAAWTSGQHWNALRPFAIALYLGPVVIAVIVAQRRQLRAPLTVAGTALAAFALAQAWNVISCVLARRAGNPVPIGGKEGWYWYVTAPIVVPALLGPALARFRAVAWWIVAWDVLITEGALFHDFAGVTSPAHPTALFRWGPLHVPFTADLHGIGVGPFVGGLLLLRLIHLAAFFALESLAHADDRSNPLALSNH